MEWNRSTRSEAMVVRQKRDALERLEGSVAIANKKSLCPTDNQAVACDLFLKKSFFFIYRIMHFKNILLFLN